MMQVKIKRTKGAEVGTVTTAKLSKGRAKSGFV